MTDPSAIPADALAVAETALGFLAQPAGEAFTSWHDEREEIAVNELVEMVITGVMDGTFDCGGNAAMQRLCIDIRLARTWKEDYIPAAIRAVEAMSEAEESTASY